MMSVTLPMVNQIANLDVVQVAIVRLYCQRYTSSVNHYGVLPLFPPFLHQHFP